MPSTIIRKSTDTGRAGSKGSRTFTGDVWVDPIHNTTDTKINNIMFAPGARSHWHTHERGQLLMVIAGSGWICDRGGRPRRLVAGDAVWADAGTTHWHGGDDVSYMCHLAMSHGVTTWHGQVTEDEYARKSTAATDASQ